MPWSRWLDIITQTYKLLLPEAIPNKHQETQISRHIKELNDSITINLPIEPLFLEYILIFPPSCGEIFMFLLTRDSIFRSWSPIFFVSVALCIGWTVPRSKFRETYTKKPIFELQHTCFSVDFPGHAMPPHAKRQKVASEDKAASGTSRRQDANDAFYTRGTTRKKTLFQVGESLSLFFCWYSLLF